MKREIVDVRDAAPIRARTMVRLGFELETQATDGKCSDDCESEPELDEDAWDEARSEWEHEQEGRIYDWSDYVSQTERGALIAWCQLQDWLSEANREATDAISFEMWSMERDRTPSPNIVWDAFTQHENLDDTRLTTVATSPLFCDVLDIESIRETISDASWDAVDQSEYETRPDACDPSELFSLPDDIEVGLDQSVAGFEFRTTDGGLTYMECLTAADRLFRMKHKIDPGCSFHVHVSVPDVKHYWGRRMQLAMAEGVLENWHLLPASVRARIQSIDELKWFSRFVGKEEKYCFVRAHPQGTWEFRCFGNVQNATEAKQCMDVAVLALQYAYRVMARQIPLHAETSQDPEQALRMCAQEGVTPSEGVRRIRKTSRAAA